MMRQAEARLDQWRSRDANRVLVECVSCWVTAAGTRELNAALHLIAGPPPRTLIDGIYGLRKRRCSSTDVGVNTSARDVWIRTFDQQRVLATATLICLIFMKCRISSGDAAGWIRDEPRSCLLRRRHCFARYIKISRHRRSMKRYGAIGLAGYRSWGRMLPLRTDAVVARLNWYSACFTAIRRAG